MMDAIHIQQLTKTYPGGLVALKGIDLTIHRGEFFGILGPNGAGKSTLIQCLGGLLKPSTGDIRLMGHDLKTDRRLATQQIGIVPQEITFDPFLTVWETLRYQAGFWGVTKPEPWIEEILVRLSLDHKKHERVQALSGGMKRRVLVAQALVHRPAIIVLDEPTAGVDLTLRESLWTFMGELNQQGHTIILTTHHLDEAQTHCGRIAIMKEGEIVALDETAKLLQATRGLRVQFDLQTPPNGALLSPRLIRFKDQWGFQAQDADDALEGLNQLKAAGLHLERVSMMPPTLEDVFTALTRLPS